MSTITCKVHVTKTDKRFSRRIVDATGNVETNMVAQQFVSIGVDDEPFVHEFSNLCVVNFSSPTVIQLVIGGITTTPTVVGPMVLPLAGRIVVSHPGGGRTSPVEYSILTS